MSRRIRPGEGWELALGELLTYLGWTWQHTRPAYVPGRRAPITPMSGPAAAGWPDFTAYRLEGPRGAARFLVAEAKAGDSPLTAVQRARLEDLDSAGVEAYRFRERDHKLVRAVLEARDVPDLLAIAPEGVDAALRPWRVRRSSRRVATAGARR